jgi:predicted unusual protein kinase regulating ubiquinone biosynthesis (AarF/ABC1/UbiB family)
MTQILKTKYKIKLKNYKETFLVRSKKCVNLFKSYVEFKYLKNVVKISDAETGIWIKNKLISMGPTFIKIGQFMSTRTDVFGEEIVNELKDLQDNVAPITYEELEEYINPILIYFESIEKDPIASASIGQVHIGKLKSGEQIVIKVKRPNIEKQISEDFELLLFVVKVLKKISDDRQINEFEILFKEYYNLLKEEIDFKREALTMQKFSKFFIDKKVLKVPTVFLEFSNENVITMEYVPCIKINNISEIDKLKFNKEKIAQKLVELFISQIIDSGLVHIDPHPGNVGITEKGKIVFYDFGMVLNIDLNIKEKFTSFLIAIYDKDINEICNIAIEIGLITVEPQNIPYFKTFLISFISYIEKADIEDFKISYINKISQCEKAPFLITSKFVLLLRGISILEGICKNLDPDFNFKKTLDPYIDEFIIDVNYFEKRAMTDFKLITKVPDNVQINKIQIEVLEKNIREYEIASKKEFKEKDFKIIGLSFIIFMQHQFNEGFLAAIVTGLYYLIIING